MGKINKTRDRLQAKWIRRYNPSELPLWKKINRSYEKITRDDLERLLKLTRDDYQEFIKRNPQYKDLKVLSICLCQGAALHYLDGKNGIRDFDTYIFFEKHPTIRYPFRRKGLKDFGGSKFGKTYIRPENANSNKFKNLKGRLIDIMGRQIDLIDHDYQKSIQHYLSEAMADTPYLLSQKAVVVLEPKEDLGKIIWPKPKN